MKKSIKKFLVEYIIRPTFISLAICAIILLEIYLEGLCLSYARLTYIYLPLYGIKIIDCLIWAVMVRIFIAVKRKKTHKGRVGIMYSALVSVFVLAIIGAFDYFFLTKNLIWNQLFDIYFVLSCLCVIMRKKD